MSWTDIANIILTVGQTAYQAREQRKAQEEAQRANLIGRLTVEGQAPQLVSGAQMISDQPIMGSDVSQTLASLQYNPNAGYTQGLQMESEGSPEVPPELLALLMAEQEGPQFAATGGPVGKPDDTYYFSVEDIQGMMQEPDPMMQAVGAGLMQQMPPGGGMVPATPGQIQMMAEGGLVGNQHKIDKNNNGRIDGQDFQILRRADGGGISVLKKFEDFLTKSVGLNPKDVEWASSLSEKMYPGEELDGRGDAARHLALGSLIPDAESPNAAEFLSIAREYIPIPDSGREMDMFNNELGMTLTGSKEEIEEQIRELIENNTAMYMELDESQKMRGY